MKLIDADKLQDWIDRTEFAFYGRYGETGEGVVKALGMLKEQLDAGNLSPTPPVQPDTRISKEEFERGYCERSEITREFYNEYYVTLPCTCEEAGCEGWASVSNTPLSIKAHNKNWR